MLKYRRLTACRPQRPVTGTAFFFYLYTEEESVEVTELFALLARTIQAEAYSRHISRVRCVEHEGKLASSSGDCGVGCEEKLISAGTKSL